MKFRATTAESFFSVRNMYCLFWYRDNFNHELWSLTRRMWFTWNRSTIKILDMLQTFLSAVFVLKESLPFLLSQRIWCHERQRLFAQNKPEKDEHYVEESDSKFLRQNMPQTKIESRLYKKLFFRVHTIVDICALLLAAKKFQTFLWSKHPFSERRLDWLKRMVLV